VPHCVTQSWLVTASLVLHRCAPTDANPSSSVSMEKVSVLLALHHLGQDLRGPWPLRAPLPCCQSWASGENWTKVRTAATGGSWLDVTLQTLSRGATSQPREGCSPG